MDKSSFSIAITPTDVASICVQQYNLTFTCAILQASATLQASVLANMSTFDSSSVSFESLGHCTTTIGVEVVADLGGVATEMNILLIGEPGVLYVSL